LPSPTCKSHVDPSSFSLNPTVDADVLENDNEDGILIGNECTNLFPREYMLFFTLLNSLLALERIDESKSKEFTPDAALSKKFFFLLLFFFFVGVVIFASSFLLVVQHPL
jgi:hypothetical protein